MKNNGISLVRIIVTIVVLIILGGVAIGIWLNWEPNTNEDYERIQKESRIKYKQEYCTHNFATVGEYKKNGNYYEIYSICSKCGLEIHGGSNDE